MRQARQILGVGVVLATPGVFPLLLGYVASLSFFIFLYLYLLTWASLPIN